MSDYSDMGGTMGDQGPAACPVCRRIDGGHDQNIHDSVEKHGTKAYSAYPVPGDSPTGEQD